MKSKIFSFTLTLFAASIGSAIATYSINSNIQERSVPQHDQVTNPNSPTDLEVIRKTIQASLPATPIRSVSPAAINGLYEVITPNGLMHTDEQGRYLFVGGIYDPKTNTDLVKARKIELGFTEQSKGQGKSSKPAAQPITPKIIPQQSIQELEQYAITYQEVNDAPVIYEIFDPMCGACRNNTKELAELPVTVKKILIPSVGSDEINQQVYCSMNPKEAIDSLIQSSTIISDGRSRANCDVNDLESIKSWMKANNLPMATPLIIEASTGILYRGANSRTVWSQRLGL